eukprot:COSAG01_NODE_1991_length_8696_cov_971.862743_13_plen_70_part_00
MMMSGERIVLVGSRPDLIGDPFACNGSIPLPAMGSLLPARGSAGNSDVSSPCTMHAAAAHAAQADNIRQ